MQVGICEVAFVIEYRHMSGETRLDMFVSAAALLE